MKKLLMLISLIIIISLTSCSPYDVSYNIMNLKPHDRTYEGILVVYQQDPIYSYDEDVIRSTVENTITKELLKEGIKVYKGSDILASKNYNTFDLNLLSKEYGFQAVLLISLSDIETGRETFKKTSNNQYEVEYEMQKENKINLSLKLIDVDLNTNLRGGTISIEHNKNLNKESSLEDLIKDSTKIIIEKFWSYN